MKGLGFSFGGAISFVCAVFFASSVGGVGKAEAYPIFFKCDANGGLSDVLTAPEIQEAIRGATQGLGSGQAATQKKILELCEGREECFSVLKQALLLTQVSVSAAEVEYRSEMKKLEALAARLDQSIDPEVDRLTRDLYSMANEVYACRKTQEGLPWQSFNHGQTKLYSDGSYVDGVGLSTFIQHRVDNEYLYVTGYKGEGQKGNQASFNLMWNIVELATISGLDPYAALAISYMESPTLRKIMLDPSTAMTMMGCSSKPVASVDDHDDSAIQRKTEELRRSGKAFYYNFGKFYEMGTGVATSSSSKRVAELMAKSKDRLSVLSDEPALACFQNEGAFIADAKGAVIQDYGQKGAFSLAKACCIRVPYASSDAFYLLANEFMRTKLNASGKPEAVLQRFNGSTKLMGLNEKAGVGAFRLGLNLQKDPQYGYQGMDFILNSFLSNPSVRAVVEQVEDIHGKTKSLLCSGRQAGAFAIDSDHFLEREKNSERFEALMGKSWEAMSGAEKRLMQHEWKLMLERKGARNAKHSDAQHADYRKKLDDFEKVGGDAAKWAYYRERIYPGYRRTLEQTSYRSWKRLTDEQVRDVRHSVVD
jgi:hypothetical protein